MNHELSKTKFCEEHHEFELITLDNLSYLTKDFYLKSTADNVLL